MSKSSVITTMTFDSAKHDLQNMITETMHDLVMERGDFTLAELGYLFSSTLGYSREEDQIHLRIYFDPRLACRAVRNPNTGKKSLVPVAELYTFQNYFFVGQVTDCMGFTKMTLPKYKVEADELDRAAVKFKDNDKYEEVTVMYLECNLAITLAAICNIDLKDPGFTIKYSMDDIKKKKSALKVSINPEDYNQFPIDISVQYSGTPEEYNIQYDPEDAIPYLTERMQKRARDMSKLAEVEDRIHKEKKKVKSNQERHYSNKGFDKFS